MLLEKEPGIEIAGEAENGKDVVRIVESGIHADVILADMNMPGMSGVEVAAHLKAGQQSSKVLILSMLDSENYVSQALSMGAYGYVLKNTSRDELIFALKHVASGKKYICSEIALRLLNSSMYRDGASAHPKISINLSKREMEVLHLIAEGYTNNEIAGKLFTSRRTVEGHRKNLIEKTGARNTAALIRFAITQGLLK